MWKAVFQPTEDFQIMTVDKLLDESEVIYSTSQHLKSKEIDTYKYFCDVMQILGEGGIYCIHSINFSLTFTYLPTFTMENNILSLHYLIDRKILPKK